VNSCGHGCGRIPDPNRSEGQAPGVFVLVRSGALGGTRTPNLLIRSQMLYPLSYERRFQQYTAFYAATVRCWDRLHTSTAVLELLIL
jgi:hypothetical protein